MRWRIAFAPLGLLLTCGASLTLLQGQTAPTAPPVEVETVPIPSPFATDQPSAPPTPSPVAPTEFRAPSGLRPNAAPSYLLPSEASHFLERYRSKSVGQTSVGIGDPSSLPVIQLDDVLRSIASTYPMLTIAELDRSIARAQHLIAQGSFDFNLRAGGSINELGYYQNRRLDAGFQQHTTFMGATIAGGYAVSGGNFPSYYGSRATREHGEWTGGLNLPLLRNRAIDDRRAALQRTAIGRDLADFNVEKQQIDYTYAAAQAYWAWLAAGQRYRYAQEVLEIATLRQSILVQSAELGEIPMINVTDNQRAILQRQSTLLSAERGVQQTAIALSLFLRDAAGNPYIPRTNQLPQQFPAPARVGVELIEEASATAMGRRPEMQVLENRRKQVEVDAALARNQLNPNLDLKLSYNQASGDPRGVLRGPEELLAGLDFSLPVQRRQATGRVQEAEAKLAQVRAQEQFQRDSISAEVRNALLAVQLAYDRLVLLQQEVAVATQLQQLEKERFDLGDSTLFLVNLREEATFDAELRVVSAREEYFRAWAGYQAATAEALSGNPLSLPDPATQP